MRASSERRQIAKDCLDYFEHIDHELADTPQVRQDLISAAAELERDEIGAVDLICWVMTLLDGRRGLLLGLNEILPDWYKIDEDVMVPERRVAKANLLSDREVELQKEGCPDLSGLNSDAEAVGRTMEGNAEEETSKAGEDATKCGEGRLKSENKGVEVSCTGTVPPELSGSGNSPGELEGGGAAEKVHDSQSQRSGWGASTNEENEHRIKAWGATSGGGVANEENR